METIVRNDFNVEGIPVAVRRRHYPLAALVSRRAATAAAAAAAAAAPAARLASVGVFRFRSRDGLFGHDLRALLRTELLFSRFGFATSDTLFALVREINFRFYN